MEKLDEDQRSMAEDFKLEELVQSTLSSREDEYLEEFKRLLVTPLGINILLLVQISRHTLEQQVVEFASLMQLSLSRF